MRQLLIKPVLYEYATFKEFAAEFTLGAKDLILTNEYIYQPIMEREDLPCQTLFQEKYGTGEPDDVMVQAIMNEVKKMDIDRIIAVGGGSIIDIAKILVLGGSDDVYGLYDKADQLTKEKQLVVIPTTCGTGSEVTSISILNLSKLATKKGLVLDAMFADSAVLIPEFLQSLPYYVFATSSIDALIHATEGFLSPRATYFSDVFSERAIRDILLGYSEIAKKGEDARFELGSLFLRASTCGGVSISNPGGGTVHALSYALGGKYHVAHGECNYVFFTNVLRLYKQKDPGGKIKDLEALITDVLGGSDGIDEMDKLLAKVFPRKTMADFGATAEDVPVFAKSTEDNQQRLLLGSYAPLSYGDIEALFRQSL